MGGETTMILLLDTSTPICYVTLVDGARRFTEHWQADRSLAQGLLRYLDTTLTQYGYAWHDITGLGAYQGPGSFTGLRIGLTVFNTIADSEQIPIVGGQGEHWQTGVLDRLARGENDKLVMPFYGSDAHITQPRK